MARYLIEVAHEGNKAGCELAVGAFKRTGSHFLSNADWGCADDVHKCWVMLEVDNKKDAIMVVPPEFRKKARVITLEKLSSVKAMEKASKEHKY